MLNRQKIVTVILIVVGGVLVTTTGCAVSSEGTSGGDPTVISQKEIQGVGEISNAYNLVQRLHPQWLRKRGRNSLSQPGDIVVYVEGSRRGSPEALRQIDVVDVEKIKYLRPDEATMRYGSGHDNGVIFVHLKGGQ